MKHHLQIFHFAFLLCCSCNLFGQTGSDSNFIPDFKEEPPVVWKFNASQPFMSSPVIEKQMVFVGNLDSCLYALELSTGKVNWKFKTNGPIRSNVCIKKNNLFLLSGDGNLYCLNQPDGNLKWTFNAKDKMYDVYDYYQSSPVWFEENIYFGCGDGNVYAVNSETGKQVWSFATGNVVHSTPAISGGKLFIGSFDGNVYALNVKTGKQVWKFKSVGHDYFPKGEMQFSPVADYGIVFISGRDYNLYALDMEKGYCHWNREFPSGWAPSITHSKKNDSIIYVGISDGYFLFALNALNGRELWKSNMKCNIFGKIALSETMGYVPTLIGKLYGFDLQTGEIKWSFATDGYNNHHLEYFKSDDTFRNDIVQVITSNEDFLIAQRKFGAIYSSPAITKDYIIVSSTDGTVYCLKRK